MSLAGFGVGTLLLPLPLGVAAGLLAKQVGVLGAVWGAARFRLATRPRGASWAQVYGTALLCGIDFTMNMFIGGLASTDQGLVNEVKIGVLAGAILAVIAGYNVPRLSARKMVR